MDKKSIIGIVLIFVILVVFSLINQPSKEEVEAARQRRDSIAQVEAQQALELQKMQEQQELQNAAMEADTAVQNQIMQQKVEELGAFGTASVGTEEFTTLENNQVKITFSNKGGRIYSVELKDYKTYDERPLILFDGQETMFGLNFFAQNRSITTDNLYFEQVGGAKNVVVNGPEVEKGDEGKIKFNKQNPGGKETVSFRLEVAPGNFIEYVYTLSYNSFMVDFDVNMQGMDSYISRNQSYLNFSWAFDVPRQEHYSRFGEDRYTYMTYKFNEDEVDNLDKNKSDEENLPTSIKWIGFKQLFFNSTIISDEAFPNAQVRQEKYDYEDNQNYLGNFRADIAVPFNGTQNENIGMQFYFGPNHYQTLKQYGLDMERQIDLGYAIVRPVNRYVIIPVFNWLRRSIDNFGIIILLLTVMIKVVLFPFTYKSYMSQAKMRALKPEVDEINAKFPGQEKAMEKQQATMALYRKAGVNPMGGCLPMVLQMPILFAMFFFFPTSIELRGESFLWANDLSTYDSILSWDFTIPIIGNFMGNHLSLFTILMTITTIISTKLSQSATSSQGMPGMKTMMYMMPVMFFFLLNSYPSGLSYYYFLANLITIGQTYLIRSFVDDEKIRAQLQANKKKPAKKQSNFQKRLEEMAKQRGVQTPKRK
ncbi:membrane protein insertase YidC [Draconibacterium sp. IB214405]|uniref:membrane protein insertase YidC n=1 Tax=Draconibacterium sp. IB214405 TaxID=3097352 RepID=UPI002A14BD09|nr:membrane protein insertase YidC [Draconibacterium sp. IB214405]MDX8339578.1 membrane protein insertase YidC [Draconibacterium sp. IB214405]